MMMNTERIFGINTSAEFESETLSVFHHQYRHNKVYQEFCNYLGKTNDTVQKINDIPFLPIAFFKSKTLLTGKQEIETTFTSSGTTGALTSKHHVIDLTLYEQSYLKGFAHFYGEIQNYCVLALLPSYLEREGSSLIYMVNDLIQKSVHPESGFYLHNTTALATSLERLEKAGTRTILIGVSFALLDLIETHSFSLSNTLVMETGGMKGRRKELIREELHALLKKGFGLTHIHSEYGMTELLSQAYSKGTGIFKCPPWMRVFARDTEDPLTLQGYGKTGGLNIIDLANVHSCSFIATQDLGKVYEDESFEIIGRFDHSDVRGCNLMVL